jgi:two-component system sensor histidine kinase KdpD
VADAELRIYLAAAPGAGKTYAMLDEAQRRASRGTEVVIANVATHGRSGVAARLEGLPRIPPLAAPTGLDGAIDVAAILARRPKVVAVDELASNNPEGSQNAFRWQDVAELLSHGISVLTTINIEELESVAEVARDLGFEPTARVPDRFVQRATQVHFVDQTPEAIRRRLAHGNIYSASELDAATTRRMSEETLRVLRELALAWMLDHARAERGRTSEIGGPRVVRERVVVGLTGGPTGDAVVRRAAHLAGRLQAELIGLHVRSAAEVGSDANAQLERDRATLVALGGSYHEVASNDVASALVAFASAQDATQLVLGSTRRTRWVELIRGSLINEAVGLAGIDVHVVSTPSAPSLGDGRLRDAARPLSRVPSPFGVRRSRLAWVLSFVAPCAMTAVLWLSRSVVDLSSQLLLYLVAVCVVAVFGGVRPAVVAALTSSVLANWFFTPPVHTLAVDHVEDIIALVVFLTVGIVIGSAVSMMARRSAIAASARSDAGTLAAMAGAVAGSTEPMPEVLQHLADVFGARGAALRRPGGGREPVEQVGEPFDVGSVSFPIGNAHTLELLDPTRTLDASTLDAFTDQIAIAIEQGGLRRAAEYAEAMERSNRLRAGLLAAVSHDFRTPLASIKAAASSLRQRDIEWEPEVREELLATIETGTDRVIALVTNLLGMSRIQAGAVEPLLEPTSLDEVAHKAVAGLEERGRRVRILLEEQVPLVRADAALLERVIANVVDNACTWSPAESDIRVDAVEHVSTVDLRVVDRGPGIAVDERDSVVLPFHRAGEHPRSDGAGLGLAVAHGFVELMHGRLTFDDTPGGGTTVVISLPRAGVRRYG